MEAFVAAYTEKKQEAGVIDYGDMEHIALKLLTENSEIAEEYRPFVEAHKNMPYRAQTVSYRILARYLELLKGIAPALALKAEGKEHAALEEFTRFADDFGKYELEMERNYDHYNLVNSFNRIFKKITVLFDA